MREAFSQKHDIVLKNDKEKEEKKENLKKKKTPLKKETLQKLGELGIDAKGVYFEEDAQALIEQKSNTKKEVKRSKQDQIRFEAVTLASNLDITVSESVGINGILDAIKEKIDEQKKEAGNDISKMAEALSFEVSYKSICTENEVYNNTRSRKGESSLADYNRFMLGL